MSTFDTNRPKKFMSNEQNAILELYNEAQDTEAWMMERANLDSLEIELDTPIEFLRRLMLPVSAEEWEFEIAYLNYLFDSFSASFDEAKSTDSLYKWMWENAYESELPNSAIELYQEITYDIFDDIEFATEQFNKMSKTV